MPDWAGSRSFLTLRPVFQKKWYDRKVRCHKGSVENPPVRCATCMRTTLRTVPDPSVPAFPSPAFPSRQRNLWVTNVFEWRPGVGGPATFGS